MKKIKLFEEFTNQEQPATPEVNEGAFKEIDIIGQEAETKEEFKKNLKNFLKSAHDPKIADDDAYIEELSKPYFDEDGNKIETN